MEAKDDDARQPRTLFLWTQGSPTVNVAPESAEVSAPQWLMSSAIYDPETFDARLAEFKDKIREAFATIWEGNVYAAYDFELDADA